MGEMIWKTSVWTRANGQTSHALVQLFSPKGSQPRVTFMIDAPVWRRSKNVGRLRSAVCGLLWKRRVYDWRSRIIITRCKRLLTFCSPPVFFVKRERINQGATGSLSPITWRCLVFVSKVDGVDKRALPTTLNSNKTPSMSSDLKLFIGFEQMYSG